MVPKSTENGYHVCSYLTLEKLVRLENEGNGGSEKSIIKPEKETLEEMGCFEHLG